MAKRGIRSALRQQLADVDTDTQTGLIEAAYETGAELRSMLLPVVRTWEDEHKPRFDIQVEVNGKAITMRVEASGEGAQIFKWVDEGTDGPYTIRPKQAGGYLTFQGGHNAKTAPVAKYNQGDGGRTGNWAKVREVTHPGIKARKFTETFEAEILPIFRRRIENAFRRATRRRRG